MNQNQPVGQNCPPQFPVPQNQPAPLQNVPVSPPYPFPAPYPMPAQNTSPPAYGNVSMPYTPYVIKKEKLPLPIEKADGPMALFALLLGFLFVRWVSPVGGWGVTLFTFMFCGSILFYARAKNRTPSKESWYWLAITLLTSCSFSLWPGNQLTIWRFLLLFGSAVYWCASLFGVLLANKTSNYLFFDAVNILFPIPFKNMDCLPRTLSSASTKTNQSTSKRTKKYTLSVFLGLAASVPILAIVLPLLASADKNVFGKLLTNLIKQLQAFSLWEILTNQLGAIFLQLILGIPVALYLFGLVLGSANKRYHSTIQTPKIDKTLASFSIVPLTSILVVLFMVSLVYLLFIILQLPYFFSAFAGLRPLEYQVYSSYAREGFFELCSIAFINLVLLALSASLCKPHGRKKPVYKFAVILLSVLTLLVVITALSKMVLYISAYGLTSNRVLPSVFMLFLAGIFSAIGLLQFKPFSIVRFAAIYGAGLLCFLCLINLDGWVVRYNASRYLNGSLPTFHSYTAYTSGPAGVPSAFKVYNSLDAKTEYEQKEILAYAIHSSQEMAQQAAGTSRDNLAYFFTRNTPSLHQTPEKEEARSQLFWDDYWETEQYS